MTDEERKGAEFYFHSGGNIRGGEASYLKRRTGRRTNNNNGIKGRNAVDGIRKSSSVFIFSILFTFGTTHAIQAQTLSASGQLSDTASGGGFQYTLTLNNSSASTTNIETFWFSWVPGEDFMAVNPTSIVSPAGWTNQVTHVGSGDGFAIQFVTSTAPLAPGGSLTFTFTSTSSPATMAGDSPFHAANPIGTSFVYSGPPLSGVSDEFVVETLPGPSVNPTNLVSLSFSNVMQVCRSRTRINRMTGTTNITTTCRLSLQLVATNLGITNSPAFNVLVWAGQGSNFDASVGLSPATEKVKALRINKLQKIRLRDTFNSSQTGTFLFCTDTSSNAITSVQIE